jgi:hypothetical protein
VPAQKNLTCSFSLSTVANFCKLSFAPLTKSAATFCLFFGKRNAMVSYSTRVYRFQQLSNYCEGGVVEMMEMAMCLGSVPKFEFCYDGRIGRFRLLIDG